MLPTFTPEEYAEIALVARQEIGKLSPGLGRGGAGGEEEMDESEEFMHKFHWGRKFQRLPKGALRTWARGAFKKTAFGRAAKQAIQSLGKDKTGALIGGLGAAMKGGGFGAIAGGAAGGAAAGGPAAAAKLLFDFGKKVLDTRTGIVTQARAQLEASEGLMAGPQGDTAFIVSPALFPRPDPWQSLQRSYTKVKDAYHGAGSAKDTFVESLWEGNGFGRAWTEASQEYNSKQTFKHPDVYKAADVMGTRTQDQLRNKGLQQDSGWKELGAFGG